MNQKEISQEEHDAVIDEKREQLWCQFSTQERDLIKRCQAFDPIKTKSFEVSIMDLIMVVAKMAHFLNRVFADGNT